jgi:Mg2+-importing ATPase
VAVPIYLRCFKIWRSASSVGRWLDARRARKRAQLNSFEVKSSAFLADCANLAITECLAQFNSSVNGLNHNQISDLVTKYGPNLLSAAKARRWWTILFECIPNPFNVLLTALAVISIATQQQATFVILIVMVILSVGLKFWQEMKNNVAMNELMKLVQDNVNVIRDGAEIEISKHSIVPGDIVRLRGGDIVPADAILVDTSGLYVSQSTLTGESAPVLKQTTDDKDVAPHSIFDSMKICFAGTTIASGSATALVVATGDGIYLTSKLMQIHTWVHYLEASIRKLTLLNLSGVSAVFPTCSSPS